jgi:hypothetical protein
MTKPSRRWFQFSIRTLLILMLLVATYFAGFVTSQKLAEKELREAEEKAAAELAAAKSTAATALQADVLTVLKLKTGVMVRGRGQDDYEITGP